MFTRAIVRQPTSNFAAGLTTANLGRPDFNTTLRQHQAYCDALSECGLSLTFLVPDSECHDSTFVEDTAVVTEKGAVITRPGAPSRRAEIKSVAAGLIDFYDKLDFIKRPGKIDAGDVC